MKGPGKGFKNPFETQRQANPGVRGGENTTGFSFPHPVQDFNPESYGTLRRTPAQPQPQQQAPYRPGGPVDPRRMSLSRLPTGIEQLHLYDPSAYHPAAAAAARGPQPLPTPPMPATPPGLASPAMSNAPESWAASMMQKCGFERDRVSLHWSFTEVLEKIWQEPGFVFTGNFAEGWGYSTVRVDGRCGYDSQLNCKYVVPGYTVHIDGACCCRVPVKKVVLNEDGSVTLNTDCLVHLRQMNLVKEDAVRMVGELKRRPTTSLGLTASGPALSLEQVFPCCQRPRLPRLELLDMPELANQPVYVKPNEFELQMGGRTAKQPTGQLDISLIDRALFRGLSSRQGRLYVALKILLLEEFPKAKYLNAACFSEAHCKQVLLHYLLAKRRTASLAGDVRDALQMLASKNADNSGPLLRDNQLRSAAFPKAWLPLASDCPGPALVHKALLSLVNDSEQLLLYRLRHLQPTADDGTPGIALFQPMSLAIPGHKRQLAAGPDAVRSLAGCRDVGFLVYRVVERLLLPQLSDDIISVLTDIEALRALAGVAAVCLQCLVHLKLNEPELARQALQSSRAAMQRVLREFPLNSTADSMEQYLLNGFDCAWQFKAKISIEEPQHTSTQQYRPFGTAFLASYPLIRYIFFPCRMTRMQQMNGCLVEYTLNINFLALMNCLVVQTVPLNPQNTELWRWFDANQPLEAQELFALSLSDHHLDLQQLKRLCQRLFNRLLPMHLPSQAQQQNRPPELDYLEHLRIRLLHRCIRSLPSQTNWGREEVATCRQLAELHTSNQSIASILTEVRWPDLSRDAASRVLSQLCEFHKHEIDHAFGSKLAKGQSGDLGRQFLAASLYSWYCLDSGKAKKYKQILASFNTGLGPNLFPEEDIRDTDSRLT